MKPSATVKHSTSRWWPAFGTADLPPITPIIQASQIRNERLPSDDVCTEDDTHTCSFAEQEQLQQAKESARLLKKFHDEFLISGQLNNSNIEPVSHSYDTMMEELLKKSKSVRDVFNGLHQANVSKQTSEVV